MLAHFRMTHSGKPFIRAEWEAMFEFTNDFIGALYSTTRIGGDCRVH